MHVETLRLSDVFEVDSDSELSSLLDDAVKARGPEPGTEPANAPKRRKVRPGARSDVPPLLVACSTAMQQVVARARRLAGVGATVLILGESGVGKDRIARLIHEESPRSSGPFVALNCGAIPDSLLESELFGHARGAFTGATSDRRGLFEATQGGTLLLDEVAETPLSTQIKLLRVIEERQVRRLGEHQSRPFDVRLIAATHRDLAEEVARGRFRQDLYYRLRVVDIRIPPLRDRPDDILPLARMLLAETVERMGHGPRDFTAEACRALLEHSWPGNTRELRNAMDGAAALGDCEEITLTDLPREIIAHAPTTPPTATARSLADAERRFILDTLSACQNNRTEAAKRLGISSATLFRKLKQYGVGTLRH